MKPVSYPITDKQVWLENRLLDVTSTEVSSLFGLSPYKTEYELYHEKKEKHLVSVPDNPRMAWGRRLEDSIAQGCAAQMNWKVEQFDEYLRIPELRIGSSFDYKITSTKEPGILEVKNVDWLAFKKSWIVHPDETIEAPPHIELQLHHQLLVTGYSWGCICALVGGNDLKTVIIKKDPLIQTRIKNMVKIFWENVKNGTPPEIDFNGRDSSFILENSTAVHGLEISSNEDLDVLIDKYAVLRKSIKHDEDELKSIKAQIIHLSQGASKIISKYGTITCGMTNPSVGKLVTPEMVGTYINPRRAFRQFKFNQPKGV